MRIPIPENPDEFITLAKAISLKHTALGANSPLDGIEDIELLAPLAATADTNNQAANNLYQQAKTATEARDRAIGPNMNTPRTLHFLVDAVRNVLSGQNKGKEHNLGGWGFTVIDMPAVTPEAKAAAKAAKAAAKAAKQSAGN